MEKVPNDKNLNYLRQAIDEVDEQLIVLISKRMKLVAKIGEYKARNDIPPLDENRWDQVINSRISKAEMLGLKGEIVRQIWELMHSYALDLEENISKE
ncbi:chorismate mutase [Candidatus Dojkabacteria bacterium]|nr:chorismate mutase [Candidatus Dojkabacteria bacterium]